MPRVELARSLLLAFWASDEFLSHIFGKSVSGAVLYANITPLEEASTHDATILSDKE